MPSPDFTRNKTAYVALLARIGETFANVSRRRHRLAAHIENDIADLEAVIGGNAAVGDRGDDNAFAVASRKPCSPGASVKPSFGTSLSGTSRWFG